MAGATGPPSFAFANMFGQAPNFTVTEGKCRQDHYNSITNVHLMSTLRRLLTIYHTKFLCQTYGWTGHIVLALGMATRMNNQFVWQKGAACAGAPSYIFFPEEVKRPGFKENPAFKGKTYADFCHFCPVKWRCREFAKLHDEHGVWGDATEGQRNKSTPSEEIKELREYKEARGEYWPLYGHRQDNSLDI